MLRRRTSHFTMAKGVALGIAILLVQVLQADASQEVACATTGNIVAYLSALRLG